MADNEITENIESNPSPVEGDSRKKKFIKEVKSISMILTVVLVFRSVFFEPFRIPSGSMIPTLMIGDFILVNKFSYGFKVPFSDLSLFGINLNPIYIFGESDPVRGDVVVFKYPKDPSINYIKRVVGVPGDKIEIRNKVVYINGTAIKANEVDGKPIMDDMDEKFKNYNLKFYKVKTGEAEHVIQQDSDNYYKTDYQQKIIPKGKFFVMGDNRDFSYDSRFWGFVKREQVKGRALFVWFSMIFPFGEDSFKFRPWRIGTVID
ncbi:MAG: signal peptidase I [Halobacteriovorax sp.]|nr:signal peptidase I [Halobacteriovorax sp.]|tara:strand:+ start:438837 stop:439622 length:786 start_codon:yes stop_codon:yes gene_type:complete